MSYDAGRKYIKTKLANFKRNKSRVSKNKTLTNLNKRIEFARGVIDEIKSRVPKSKKPKRSKTSGMDSFIGGYGSYDPYGGKTKKTKKKGGMYDRY
jgi:hypothetical protein